LSDLPLIFILSLIQSAQKSHLDEDCLYQYPRNANPKTKIPETELSETKIPEMKALGTKGPEMNTPEMEIPKNVWNAWIRVPPAKFGRCFHMLASSSHYQRCQLLVKLPAGRPEMPQPVSRLASLLAMTKIPKPFRKVVLSYSTDSSVEVSG
jgi:hypothetical protein